MDPQSVAFVPTNDSWRLQNDLMRLQQIQADHTDRLLRLERRQDDDHRMKSVWGGASPFPSVLSGTPQQAPLQHPPGDHFKDFDDEANLIGSLHLDADDEPRRFGATSRANSVRFDESANQGHWSHASRSSLEFLPRSTSSLGGLAMNERTSSHKSDGRASSVHSIRSLASGRASSLNLDTSYAIAEPARTPPETPGLAPGLLILGSVPSIIRCWMNTNFKHDALLYAAICSASHKSHVDVYLLRKLGIEDRVCTHASGAKSIELPVYFPEAVPHPTSRSSSPAPQVPALTVDFNVVDQFSHDETCSIQIFIGSDVLRNHNADIMFSTNSVTLYDDYQCKLSIPLVRPENESVFNTLRTAGGSAMSHFTTSQSNDNSVITTPHLNGLGQKPENESEVMRETTARVPTPSTGKYRPPGLVAAESEASSLKGTPDATPPSDAQPQQVDADVDRPAQQPQDTASSTSKKEDTSTTQSGSGPAAWSSWRREGSVSTSQLIDWTGSKQKTSESNNGGGYQRRDTGIKVLKPMKQQQQQQQQQQLSMSRTASMSTASPSLADGNKSRFFDEGKRRGPQQDVGPGAGDERRSSVLPSLSRKSSSTANKDGGGGGGGENAAPPPKTRTNPVGGASAFSWLNAGGRA